MRYSMVSIAAISTIYHNAESVRMKNNWPACFQVTCYILGRYSWSRYIPGSNIINVNKVVSVFAACLWEKVQGSTWKHVECITWPHGRAFTGEQDVKIYSWQIGQLSSKDFSLHVWIIRVRPMQALQFIQWKYSTPKPFPTRHRLQ